MYTRFTHSDSTIYVAAATTLHTVPVTLTLKYIDIFTSSKTVHNDRCICNTYTQ